MAIELKEVLDYMGYEPKDIDSLEKFKEKFDPEFIKRAEVAKDETLVNSVVGKRVATIETALKSAAKAAGIELLSDEIKGKKVEDITGVIFSKLNTRIKELESKSGQGNEEAVREWKEKLEKATGKISDLQSSLSTTTNEFETFKGNIENEKITFKKVSEKERALQNFKWKNGISDIEKEGFNALFDKNYKLDLDEEGKVYIGVQKGDKIERIRNPKKANEFKSIEDVLTDFEIEKGVYAVTGGEKGKPAPAQTPSGAMYSTPGAPLRTAHPRSRGIV